jgi:hypothetical protein
MGKFIIKTTQQIEQEKNKCYIDSNDYQHCVFEEDIEGKYISEEEQEKVIKVLEEKLLNGSSDIDLDFFS